MNDSRKRTLPLSIGLVLLATFVMAGCGAAATAEPEHAAPPAEREDMGGAAGEGFPDSNMATFAPDAQQVAAASQDRMIIKNGEIDLVVQDTDVAIGQVTQIAIDSGGYVLTSQSWSVGEGKSATLTIAVMSEHFETAMRRLRDIADEVLRESSSGEDVTGEYVDLESRLRNLEATRERIRSFLDEAQTVEEALKVNQELARIEAEIEQVKGRMNYLAGRTAYSTITVNLDMPEALRPTPTPRPWLPQKTLRAASKAQVTLVRFLFDAAIWLIVFFGPYAVLGVLIVLGVRALVRRRRARRQPQPGPTEQED